MIRVVLADDHAVVRAGLRALLTAESDLSIVGEAGTGEEALRLCAASRPDVLLLDITMPGNEHLAVVRAVVERVPETRVLLLTMHQDPTLLREALRLGAAGYVLKRSAESSLLAAIRTVAAGDLYIDPTMAASVVQRQGGPGLGARAPQALPHGLTSRELEVLKLAAQGYGNKEIAARLFISVKTVETHRLNINEKLGIRSRVELIRFARQAGLLDEP